MYRKLQIAGDAIGIFYVASDRQYGEFLKMLETLKKVIQDLRSLECIYVIANVVKQSPTLATPLNCVSPIIDKYHTLGMVKADELLLHPTDALRLADELEQRGILILGVDI